MEIMTVNKFREAIEYGPYAWPSGSPTYFITSGGDAISFESAEQNMDNIEYSIREMINDEWKIAFFAINWEDPNLYCAHTGERIESAYAEE